jgi:uncharacterized membrane protein
MTSNDKFRPYLFAFLAFCVLSSKHVIIYNEELLVAITFLAFVVFIFQYFGTTVKESLDERRFEIKSELERFFLLKKESLTELAMEHKKVSLLKKALDSLKGFTQEEAVEAASRGNDALKERFADQITEKLVPLSLPEISLQSKWQERLASSQLGLVLANLEKRWRSDEKITSWDPQITEKALQLLKEREK